MNRITNNLGVLSGGWENGSSSSSGLVFHTGVPGAGATPEGFSVDQWQTVRVEYS